MDLFWFKMYTGVTPQKVNWSFMPIISKADVVIEEGTYEVYTSKILFPADCK